MASRQDELEIFKTQINLSEYAASVGYQINAKKTYQGGAEGGGSTVMRSASDPTDVIVIGKDTDNHWIYWHVSVGKGSLASDAGSIIDFLQNRRGGKDAFPLGLVRQELRPWVNGSVRTRPSKSAFVSDLRPISKDLMKVKAKWEGMRAITSHRYLEEERCIPAAVLTLERFAGRIRTDWRDNAIFPHFNREGVCGYEMKNHQFTSFSSGGEKGLWCSQGRAGDTALVIAEDAIDALSYAALKHDPQARYFSTGGALSPKQEPLIRSAMELMPKGGKIILAFDHDAGGDSLAERIKALFLDLRGAGLELIDDRPPTPGDDWNDVLRASIAERTSIPERNPAMKT
ncbi:MAG: DUF3991 and TOPRIM domain-containing protein [Verrucomicrobiae bacterium]|nr:DUF3991 and TOPRIM domain-containing protein [Verrucomicrobiae bacterium]